jgi:quercetin dioxygenase-like cupin family protein
MRRLVTGIDDHGRSCVVSDIEVAFGLSQPGGVVSAEQLFSTEELPPPLGPAGRGDQLDLGVRRGLSWMMIRWEPGGEWPMHFTDTIDLDVVLDGEIELLLDDGAHRLGPGDSVVVHGVDHAWRVGPEGCTVCVTAIGSPRV